MKEVEQRGAAIIFPAVKSNHRLIITTTLKDIAYIYVSEPTVYRVQTIDYIVVLTDGQEFLINPTVYHELQEIIAGGPLC